MSRFQLIAFDMDGTLLNENKEISMNNIAAIRKAAFCGKQIALCTGRSVAELREFFSMIPEVKYHICSSGGLIYNSKDKKIITQKVIDEKHLKRIIEVSREEDIMLQLQTEEMIIEERYLANLELYGMEQFAKSYQKITYRVDDIYEFLNNNLNKIVKINLYHRDAEARERSMIRLKDVNVAKVYSEKTSIECTPIGIDKGTGLVKLCKVIGIDIRDSIAVGDANNDLPVFDVAGLALAMGNASERIKAHADGVLADNEHDGCSEAINVYLLEGTV